MTALRARFVAAFLILAVAQPLAGQGAVGTGIDYFGYTFGNGLGADAAQLLFVPMAVRLPVTSTLSLDVFGAWAEGRVERDNTVLKLSGPVDTSVKATWVATPWAVIGIGANVPTGKSAHSGEEAIVASVLSTDLLGFRDATWGTGFAVTSSLATAVQAGGFGFGVAGAYAVRGEFEPTAGDPLTYQPGNETRVRVGIDRNFGTSTLTLGGTFIQYTEDKANGDNLFQAGNRLRFDGAFAFRAGAGVWTFYGADLIRSNGDLRVPILNTSGDEVDSTSIPTAKQNLLIGGVMGTIGLGSGFVFRPHIDYKMQTRTESDGNEAGSGWIVAAGGDIPMRIFGGYEFFPKARVYVGSLKDGMGTDVSLFGLEFKGTMRWNF